MLLVELTKKAKSSTGASDNLPRRNYLYEDNSSLKPVWFPQIKGMAQFSWFQKKLSELRSRDEAPKLLRVQIKDFGARFRRLDLTELERHLYVVSGVISEVMNGEQFLFSYLGRGRFLISLQDGISENVGETAKKLQDRANLRLDQSRTSRSILLQLQFSKVTGPFPTSESSTNSDAQVDYALNEVSHALDLPRVDEIEGRIFQKALAEEKKQDVTKKTN